MRRAALSLRRPLLRRFSRAHHHYFTSNGSLRLGLGPSSQSSSISTGAASGCAVSRQAQHAITSSNSSNTRFVSASVRRFSNSAADRFTSFRARASPSSSPAYTAIRLPMQIRGFSAALAAAAVAGGAYYLRASQQNTIRADSPTSTSGRDPTAAAVRRGLVVEANGGIYDATFTGEGPLSKETDDRGRKVLEMLSPDQATERLRRSEESWLVGRGTGVTRFDLVQLPSNDPIEDDHAEKLIQVPTSVAATGNGDETSDWMFWGVFDGHSGWTTSAKLRQSLIKYVATELNTTYTQALSNTDDPFPVPDDVEAAIKKGFNRLDNEIVHESVAKVEAQKSKTAAAEYLGPALSGSCALLSFYDSNSKLLRVACTGDSRAVLGRMGDGGKWTAVPLSVDQTGQNKEEAERLRREHPGEPRVVVNGRVLGFLEPTRAFGDATYKWTTETVEKLTKNYFARPPRGMYKTPPYVTAEPIVTTTKINPDNGDFLVMATDGLWELLSNEEVVGLVGQWLEVHGAEAAASQKPTTLSAAWLASWFAQNKKQLPVEPPKEDASQDGNKSPRKSRTWSPEVLRADKFVLQDKNVATHLVRNALGGRNTDQLCALLTLPSPLSRRYRDDLTVQVIFFGKETKTTGNVTVNKEASAPHDEGIKPKL